MRIGIPKEIKALEGRVALVPEAAAELVSAGHEVLLQRGAGEASGYPDEAYARHGVRLVSEAAELFERAELIVKVKEPVGPELGWLRSEHLLFSFLHLAAEPELTRRLCEIGLTAVAFETVQLGSSLPILAPMSNVAGRIAVQWGARLLHRPGGGKGVLLGGVPSTPRGRVVVIGAGHAGSNALRMAAAMGAEVTVFDKQPEKLETMMEVAPNITARYPYEHALAEAVRSADLLVGAVLVPGARAPRVVSRELVSSMEPGSVIVDISVDQGGCVETTRPTTWEEPAFELEGVLHFGVTNMPGAVPRTASTALSASLMPWVLRLARADWREEKVLREAVNVEQGRVVHPALL